MGFGGHRPSCSLPLTLPFSLTCIFRSFLFPSPTSFIFFLPSFPVFPPSLPTLPCQFNLPLLCLAFPGSRCQASNFTDFTPEQLVRSNGCSKDTGSQQGGSRLGRKDGDGAAGSPCQSTPPALTVQAQSNSALAWRRAPRARPDLNVLFVRLALGRSSPSASVWPARAGATPPAAARPACHDLQPARGAHARSPPMQGTQTGACKHACQDEHTARVCRAHE